MPNKIREQFEIWAKENGYRTTIGPNGTDYISGFTQGVWEPWKIGAEAALAAQVEQTDLSRRKSKTELSKRLRHAALHPVEFMGPASEALMFEAADEIDRLTSSSAADRKRMGSVAGNAASDVLAERRRQVEKEGWTPEHDDQYSTGEMSVAAACYALSSDIDAKFADTPEMWPWDSDWWKPTTERRNLVKAGALILAEIERLDRAALSTTSKEEGNK